MFLVINLKTTAVMNPYSAGFRVARDREERAWNHLEVEADARAFAEYCAKKFPDQVFAVMGVLGKVKSATPPVEWS